MNRLFASLLLTAALFAEGPSLAFQKEGRGSAVVLIHGLGGNRSVWADQVRRLKTGHTVLVVELPGHGASGEVPLKDGVADLDAVAQAVVQLMRKQKAAPAILVGHSLGGALAARIAKVDPGAVEGLVLVDSFLSTLPTTFTEPLAKQLETDAAGGLKAFIRPRAASEAQAEALVKEALKAKPSALAAYLRALSRTSVDLKGSSFPISLLASPELIPDPGQEAEALARLGLAGLPKLQVQYMVNAHHWIMLDEPDTFQVLFQDLETRVLSKE